MESVKQQRWRCEFRNGPDKNLIAKFFWAVDAQEATEKAKAWYGNAPVTIVVTLDV
jgi:hypothetical protein